MKEDWLIGRTLGKYRLERLIGSGSCASVYQALHTRLRVPYAIKILHPAFANQPEVLERFFREARAAGHLQHENIVFTSDFEIEEGVGPYIVMEYLEGETLGAYMQKHETVSLGMIGEISRQVCLGLAQVHRKGLIHRDLKPDNIFLVPRENGWILVKLLDFGIAHLGPLAESITGARLVGTPKYMAPEQFRVGQQSHHIDIYSFGVILYQMLTGQVPFQGDHVHQLGLGHMMLDPPRLEEHFPSKLQGLLDQLLAKLPHERPQSMFEVWQALAPILDPERRFQHWHIEMRDVFSSHELPEAIQEEYSPTKEVQATTNTDIHV
ncbi:MAG: serine/threonine-protein kinase, partial [Myxococcota bacterium]